MSAGRGVTHSEFNPSKTEAAHLLQIWIQPRERGLTPSYTEWHPKPESDTEPKILVISSDGREGSATIHQDADIYRLRIPAGQTVTHALQNGRGLWLQIIHGAVTLGDTPLVAGDAGSSEESGLFSIHAQSDSEALLFDLR
jgi:hypothetical protein